MEIEKELRNALAKLREGKPRKFTQTVDLIINLQKYSVKKNPINLFVNVPHPIKKKKVAGFFQAKSDFVDTITPEEFKNYKGKRDMKKLVKKYDFFIAQGALMPKIATAFGRVLGPAGKMPSPQLGILLNADEKSIQTLKEKINSSVKIRVKESSIKLAVGKEDMSDDEIIENIMSVYHEVLKVLPRESDNIKNLEVKFTMTKPQKIKLR